MAWFVYFFITLIVNLFCAVFFRNFINVTELSALPIALICGAVVTGVWLRHGGDINIINDSLNDGEIEGLKLAIGNSALAGIPLYVPFVLFFGNFFKALSLLIFIFTLIAGAAAYRIKIGKTVRERANDEESERRAQEMREELGRVK